MITKVNIVYENGTKKKQIKKCIGNSNVTYVNVITRFTDEDKYLKE